MSSLTVEDLRNRFQLPEEAIGDLLVAKYFDTKIAGRLRLGEVFSRFMTNEVESASNDFEEAISVAEQHDLVAVSRLTHPNWYRNDVRQTFSVISVSLEEKEQYNLFKTFLVELLRKQNKEVLNFVEIFRNRYPLELGDLLDHINSVVENKGELFHSSIRRIQSIS
ncbi:hypothetical protein [Leptospira santarosai]|uniref:hypothetical protein n=1 Tax=Leptospira santarosai TaxID=28183 RepID=UPI0002BF3B0E|nr:hypothetical protein [Leptospira santarosai]EMP04322.1 hypothetical protein LEP1GSC171_0318 [Leptospira santarosai str. HAI1380]